MILIIIQKKKIGNIEVIDSGKNYLQTPTVVINPHTDDIRVVFPAPLGPSRAKTSPCFISKEILQRA